MGADSSPGVADHPWRRGAAQVVVADLDAPVLSAEAAHHLRRVLRLGSAEPICATDGHGGWRMCTLGTGDALEVQGPVQQHQPTRKPPLTVGFAALKGNRNELVVQKLTELGIDRIWLLHCDRSVVRWDDSRRARQLGRMQRVAREALCQCRRLWMPEICLMGFGEAVERSTAGGTPDERPLLADAGGRAPTASDTSLLVGPEGGWSDAERGRGDAVALGEHVLRAETAAIAAGAVIAQVRVGS